MDTKKAVKVLIVEDDPGDAKLVRGALSPHESEVVDCLSAAIERLHTAHFDVILLDMGLPDSQGLDTVSKVHSTFPNMPVVVFTGHDDQATGLRAVQIGAQDYLVKGDVSNNLLTRAIHYAIVRKRLEKELRASLKRLKQTEEKLQLIGSLTRHDAGNKLFMISGFAEIAREATKDETILGYLKKIEEAVEVAQNIFKFSRQYQELGIEEPQWRDMKESCEKGLSDVNLGSITVRSDLEGLEIYTDSLIEKMFYNLVDNTIRHGGEVKEIKVYYNALENELKLIYEDDGVGVPDTKKEIIFERGYGTNTGYGLDLIRSFLKISGMDIKETGEYGKGARFEITVPRGSYRIR